jgi:hypothetical protein
MDFTGKKIIFKAYHGSHLYGLNTANSDFDYKGIVIPSKEEIKNNTAPKTCYDLSSPKKKNEKNQAGDVDSVFFTLKGFLRLCEEGQTVALEMLFTPKELWIESSPEWEFMVAHRDKLVHKQMGSFFNLARKQAYKYSIKGERIEANKIVLAWANQFPENDRIEKHLASLNELVRKHESLVDTEKQSLIKLVTCLGPKKESVLHLEVSNRKNPLTTTLKHLKKGLEKTLSSYGHRALLANQHSGADFKALSHAVRVGLEAIELLTSHKLTFPLKEKERVLAIKKGEVSFADIESQIEKLLLEINELSKLSTLPEAINKPFWDKFLKTQYELALYPKWFVKLKNLF